MQEFKIGNLYKLTRKLGSGAFGEIFHGIKYKNKNKAINLKTNGEVAIKLEPINSKHPQLGYEAKIYSYLINDDSSDVDKGIP